MPYEKPRHRRPGNEARRVHCGKQGHRAPGGKAVRRQQEHGAQGCLPTAEIPGQRPLPGREERAGGEQGPAAHPGRHGHQKEIPGHERGKKRCPGAFRASFLRPYTVPSSTAWGSRATPSRRTSKWRWGSSAASKGTAVTTPSCWPMVTTSPGFTKKFSPTPQ